MCRGEATDAYIFKRLIISQNAAKSVDIVSLLGVMSSFIIYNYVFPVKFSESVQSYAVVFILHSKSYICYKASCTISCFLNSH